MGEGDLGGKKALYAVGKTDCPNIERIKKGAFGEREYF